MGIIPNTVETHVIELTVTMSTRLNSAELLLLLLVLALSDAGICCY